MVDFFQLVEVLAGFFFYPPGNRCLLEVEKGLLEYLASHEQPYTIDNILQPA